MMPREDDDLTLACCTPGPKRAIARFMPSPRTVLGPRLTLAGHALDEVERPGERRRTSLRCPGVRTRTVVGMERRLLVSEGALSTATAGVHARGADPSQQSCEGCSVQEGGALG